MFTTDLPSREGDAPGSDSNIVTLLFSSGRYFACCACRCPGAMDTAALSKERIVVISFRSMRANEADSLKAFQNHEFFAQISIAFERRLCSTATWNIPQTDSASRYNFRMLSIQCMVNLSPAKQGANRDTYLINCLHLLLQSTKFHTIASHMCEGYFSQN